MGMYASYQTCYRSIAVEASFVPELCMRKKEDERARGDVGGAW